MPGDSAKREMTAEELEAAFQAVPDDKVAEIVDGELVVSPRPALPHASVASSLDGELYGPFRRGRGGPGGWVILMEPEVHLGPRPDKLAPDLAGWRRARLPEQPETAAIGMAPDWVCEVLSDRTARIDRGKKRRIYAREGVGHLWFIDPLERTLEVYRLHAGHWHEVETYEGDAAVHAEPFDAIALDLGVLWSW